MMLVTIQAPMFGPSYGPPFCPGGWWRGVLSEPSRLLLASADNLSPENPAEA